MIIIEPPFEERHILEEESSQPERVGTGLFIGRREGLSKRGDRKAVENRKGVKEKTVWRAANFESSWGCMRWSWSRFRMRGRVSRYKSGTVGVSRT